MTEKFYYKSPIGILEIELENDTIQRLRVVESSISNIPIGDL